MLAIDVGNTQITVGLFEEGELMDVFRVSTEACIQSSSFFEYLPEVHKLVSSDVIVSSVRAAVTGIIERETRALTGGKPFIVDVSTPMGIEVRYETKETLGIDRLVCAAAARHLYGVPGRAMVVVDMGTATTIDYVTEEGVYLGGMIAPGLMSSYQGLLTAAPQLPRLDDLSARSLIGSSTADCLRSGVTMGHAAMIRGAVEMMARSKGSQPEVVLTGGLSGMVRGLLHPDYIVDEALILKGLRFIFILHNENRC
jgi:type III pantothenate kinase